MAHQTEAEKEAEEQRYAKAALANLGVTPEEELTHYHGNGLPDFRFRHAGKVIALEVVRALEPSVAMGRSARDELAGRLATVLGESGVGAHVHIILREATATALHAVDGRSAVIKAHSDIVVDIARGIASSEDSRWRRFIADMPARTLSVLIDEGRAPSQLGLRFIDSLMVRPQPQPIVTLGGESLPLDSSLVQSRIDDKDRKKLDQYRRVGADEYWLLVVATDGAGGYQDFAELEGETFASRFDRMLVLETFTGRCVDITIPFALRMTKIGADPTVTILHR